MSASAHLSRRRVPRIIDFAVSSKCFVLCEELAPEKIQVSNLAELGARIALQGAYDPKRLFQGEFFIGDYFVFKLKFRVVYVGGCGAGIEFHKPSSRFRSLIRDYYAAELSGASMFPTTSGEVAASKDGTQSLHFKNQELSELDIEISDGSVERFVLTSTELQAAVKWSRSGSIRLMSNQILTRTEEEAKRLKLAGLVLNLSSLEPEHRTALAQIIASPISS